MTTPVNIKDSDTGVVAKVTRFGQLVVAPIQYSTPVTIELDATGTAFNFITPQAGKNVVITDIIAAANKNVNLTTPANIEIFAADSATSTTPDPLIVSPQLIRSSNAGATGLNLLIDEGKWVNATTDDAEVLVTIMFYRVPSETV